MKKSYRAPAIQAHPLELGVFGDYGQNDPEPLQRGGALSPYSLPKD